MGSEDVAAFGETVNVATAKSPSPMRDWLIPDITHVVELGPLTQVALLRAAVAAHPATMLTLLTAGVG